MSKTEGRTRIVLADDHPVVLRGLRSLIASAGTYDVVAIASDGAEALESVRQHDPDLAVFDIMMPKLSGLEVLRALEGEKHRARVIFLTAGANDEQITGAVAAGAWGIMLKDAAAEELLTCLDHVSQGKRWLPEQLVGPATERDAQRRSDNEKYEGVLTSREQQIAMLVAQGLANKEISRKIKISEGTVKIHLHNVYQKLGVANRTTLATAAKRYWSKADDDQ